MKLDCKHPIMAMPMNGVSDINLAIVVAEAGAFPSISLFNYYREGKINLELLDREISRFCQSAGSLNLLLSMHWEHLLSPVIVDLLLKHNMKFVELFIRPSDHPLWQTLSQQIDILRKQDFKIFFKTTQPVPSANFDALILKGAQAAGRSFNLTHSLEESYGIVQSQVGNKLIPSGGIGNSKQVKYFMDKGAVAIGVGTMLAASEESCVSKETKQKIIESTSADIKKMGPLACRGLLFSILENDDENLSKSLRAGINGATSGCIYVGSGIDYIDKIMPIKDIVELLVKDL